MTKKRNTKKEEKLESFVEIENIEQITEESHSEQVATEESLHVIEQSKEHDIASTKDTKEPPEQHYIFIY
jgi:hypothetical protein